MNKFGILRRAALMACLLTRSFCQARRHVGFIPLSSAKSVFKRDNPIMGGAITAHWAGPRLYRGYPNNRDLDDGTSGDMAMERLVERPTQTRPEAPRPALAPSQPKIVVLGASGMIGRLVVRQLLEMPHLDVTIVALVRDFDKACRVLYDDVLVASANKNKRGPRLQLVLGDLVPADDLPGYTDESDTAWLSRAESASAFYGKQITEFDQVDNDVCSDEALQAAIQDCTTIINCVGSVRPTNIWTDLLARPFWRVLRSDVSGWCSDCRHPFYVHYQVTRKVLRLAEAEQRRRDASLAVMEAEHDGTRKQTNASRIRLIRVSDLCVTQAPWHLVPVLTNMLHSMVLRYQDLAEKEMQSSSIIDTVTLRPGDLVNEERDTATTTLQVDPSGSLPCPARVGREDVAALAVASALFDSTSEQEADQTKSPLTDATTKRQPFHYTLACRWTSESLDPYPAQGQMSDGHGSAQQALQAALRTIRGDSKALRARTRQPRRRTSTFTVDTPPTKPIIPPGKHRKLKPYGIFVAFPFYLLVWWLVRSAQYCVVSSLFSGMQRPSASLGKGFAHLGTLAFGYVKDCISLLIHTSWIRRHCNPKYISF